MGIDLDKEIMLNKKIMVDIINNKLDAVGDGNTITFTIPFTCPEYIGLIKDANDTLNARHFGICYIVLPCPLVSTPKEFKQDDGAPFMLVEAKKDTDGVVIINVVSANEDQDTLAYIYNDEIVMNMVDFIEGVIAISMRLYGVM